ncbi:MAG: hypothetical protein R6V44_03170 [Paracoccaceae bacterium]
MTDVRAGRDASVTARGLGRFEADPIEGGVRLASRNASADLPGVSLAELAALDLDWLA